MSFNKFQITQNRDQLINHLEDHLQHLRQQRQKLTKPSTAMVFPLRLVEQVQPPMSKHQLQRSIKQNKSKLQQLQQKYKLKKQFDSIQNNQKTRKFSGSINRNKETIALVDQIHLNKRKIIKQEMERAKVYLEQQKKTKKQMQKQQKKLYQTVIQRQKGLTVSNKIENILKKPKISLMDQEFILITIFQSLKDLDDNVSKDKLKDYLIYNPKVSEHFHITKKQLVGDLMVYDTQVKGQLSYKQFFQFIKSIQITFRSMNPTKFCKSIKPKENSFKPKNQLQVLGKSKTQQTLKLYNKYLTQVFADLDKKAEKILSREIIIKHINVPNGRTSKYYQVLDKHAMKQFQKRIKSIPKMQQQYYKQLSLLYVSLPELLNQFRQFYNLYFYKQQPQKEEPKQQISYSKEIPQNDGSISQSWQTREPSQFNFQDAEVESTNYEKVIDKKQLQKFDRYYQKVSKDHKQEIEGERIDHEQISKQFNKLEMYITYMDQKMNL